jgi:hypothetical protein
MRAAGTLVSTLALSVAAIGLAVAAPGADARRAAAALDAASRAVTIANSQAGSAIFSAGAVRPGQSASGTVRVGNVGDIAGSFALDRADVLDAPGAHGGRLSEHVVLVKSPVTLFAGILRTWAG